MRKNLTFSREYCGTYAVSGSCGSLCIDSKDTFPDWIEENSIASRLIYDGTVLCEVISSIENMNPAYPENEEDTKYERQVSIKVSPSEKTLPAKLQNALDERGFEKN